MKFKSQIMTQASGSIGGTTFSRARGGVLYQRARAIPTNTATTYRTQVRNAFATLVNNWTGLTNPQRASWELYAANVPVINSLGDSVHNSGQNWYIACNLPRLQSADKLGVGPALVSQAPAIFNRGSAPTLLTTADETSGLTLAYSGGDFDPNEDNDLLLIYMGRPRNETRKQFGGPWRLVAGVKGNNSSPPSSPASVNSLTAANLAWPLVAGQVIDLYLIQSLTDGRLSTRFIDSAVPVN